MVGKEETHGLYQPLGTVGVSRAGCWGGVGCRGAARAGWGCWNSTLTQGHGCGRARPRGSLPKVPAPPAEHMSSHERSLKARTSAEPY